MIFADASFIIIVDFIFISFGMINGMCCVCVCVCVLSVSESYTCSVILQLAASNEQCHAQLKALLKIKPNKFGATPNAIFYRQITVTVFLAVFVVFIAFNIQSVFYLRISFAIFFVCAFFPSYLRIFLLYSGILQSKKKKKRNERRRKKQS